MSTLNFVDVKGSSIGRWEAIVQALGIPADFMTGKHGPCPGCGGKDRFRWDKEKEAYFCSGEGDLTGGDGFDLLCHAYGWDRVRALREVSEVLGLGRETKSKPKRLPPTKEQHLEISHELTVLAFWHSDRAQGKKHDQEDIDRVELARERIGRIQEIFLGR